MFYSEEEMDEIAKCPVRLRAYYWRVAMNMQRMSRRARAASRATSVEHPVTNYRPVFEEGIDEAHWAGVLERTSAAILENIDALVETTLEREGQK
mgnify:CR=1 FL=1